MTCRKPHLIQSEINALRSGKWSGDCSDFDYIALRIEELEDELFEARAKARNRAHEHQGRRLYA
jgi:hypothetical protein